MRGLLGFAAMNGLRQALLLASLGPMLATLVSCASYGPDSIGPGDAEAKVLATMGPPAERYALAGGGTRLAYPRGPFGRHTWMVDLGADGRVSAWRQALGEAQFAALQPGTPAEAVLREIGPPAERKPERAFNGLMGGERWSYRYPTNDCLWFSVHFGPDGLLRAGTYGVDPMCDPGERASPT